MPAFFTALQRKDGRWDYVHANSSGTFATGYCAGWIDWTPEQLIETLGCSPEDAPIRAALLNATTAPHRAKYHSDGHATPEEARKCYTLYELDQSLIFRTTGQVQKPCSVHGCGRWTPHFGVMGFHTIWLCDDHKNRQYVDVVLQQLRML